MTKKIEVIIINKYETISNVFVFSSICLGITGLICFILFWRLLNRWKYKRVEEVQPQLLRLLQFMGLLGVLSSILSLIAISLK